MTIAAVLQSVRQKIPPNEARLLLAAVLKKDQVWLLAHDDAVLSKEQHQAFMSCVERRGAGEPIAYLLGHREFYGRDFLVSPAVLIPRPETEMLVDLVKLTYSITAHQNSPSPQPLSREGRGAKFESLTDAVTTCELAPSPLAGEGWGEGDRRGHSSVGADDTPFNVLDLGTGSGCIAISVALECTSARVTAIDASVGALEIATANAKQLNANVEFLQSDWFSALENRRFNVIVSNPPYVANGDPHLAQGDLRFEPAQALACGNDGLGALRKIIGAAPNYLHSNGVLVVEHGYDQAQAVQHLFQSAGFHDIAQHRDLANIVRVTAAKFAFPTEPVT